ncbi:MAG: purine-nucleoside phosphorylase [Candidatus Ozemobacteraceae bacterium]
MTTTNDMKKRIEEAVSAIRKTVRQTPTVAVVLGSGLGGFADTLTDAEAIAYGDIPHFPASTVKGHKGRLVVGKTGGKTVIAMQGRFHYYEGYSLVDVTFPIRVMISLGARDLIITNASGALNRSFAVGDLMVMTDHLNLMGANPLIGTNDETIGPRFPPMQGVYTRSLVQMALELGRKLGAPVHRGVYAAVTGPSYETAAELRALRLMGADAVGMSTVPEVIVAVHAGIKRILGVSCITDMATGEGHEDVNHEDVIKAAAAAQPYFLGLLQGMLERL